jgi:hypothetical protein
MDAGYWRGIIQSGEIARVAIYAVEAYGIFKVSTLSLLLGAVIYVSAKLDWRNHWTKKGCRVPFTLETCRTLYYNRVSTWDVEAQAILDSCCTDGCERGLPCKTNFVLKVRPSAVGKQMRIIPSSEINYVQSIWILSNSSMLAPVGESSKCLILAFFEDGENAGRPNPE